MLWFVVVEGLNVLLVMCHETKKRDNKLKREDLRGFRFVDFHTKVTNKSVRFKQSGDSFTKGY